LPKVSVIIPTYNYGKYIETAIESVLSQTYRDYEIIVIDDGSTDNTKDVIATNYNKSVRYYYQKNKGASAARNKGIRESNGEYLLFLDADDFIGKNTLSAFMNCSKKSPNRILYGSWVRYRIEKEKLIKMQVREEFKGDDLLNAWFRGSFYIVCNSIFWYHKIVQHLNGWDEELTVGDDADIAHRALMEGYQFIYCPGAVSYYQYHPEVKSISSNINSEEIAKTQLFDAKKKEKLLLEKQLLHKYKDALAVNYYNLARKHALQQPEMAQIFYEEFRRLKKYGKPPGSVLNWIFTTILGLEKKEKLADWLDIHIRRSGN